MLAGPRAPPLAPLCSPLACRASPPRAFLRGPMPLHFLSFSLSFFVFPIKFLLFSCLSLLHSRSLLPLGAGLFLGVDSCNIPHIAVSGYKNIKEEKKAFELTWPCLACTEQPRFGENVTDLARDRHSGDRSVCLCVCVVWTATFCFCSPSQRYSLVGVVRT